VLRGEWTTLWWHNVSLRSVLGLAYLVVFGSVIAFSAYVWLLRVTTPVRAGMYAYVVPIVAVLVGVVAGREPMTITLAVSLVVILASVSLLGRSNSKGASSATRDAIEVRALRRTA
jgi:drug/metabolite transporter (DMT)-like permease